MNKFTLFIVSGKNRTCRTSTRSIEIAFGIGLAFLDSTRCMRILCVNNCGKKFEKIHGNPRARAAWAPFTGPSNAYLEL